MGQHDRYFRDTLFSDGFSKMERGDYVAGLEALRIASGAEHLAAPGKYGPYDPATGFSRLDEVTIAARGGSVVDPRTVDPAALVLLGAEAEFKGFVERRTGESPDYRISGYANHLGQAIQFYREAARLGYPVANERLEALRLRLGSVDFDSAERALAQLQARSSAYRASVTSEIRAAHGIKEPVESAPKPAQKQGGCYVATAVYGSYDSPEVRVLRRWRDRNLSRTTSGRIFIRAYYLMSPSLVRAFGDRSWFTRIARVPVSRLVAALKRSGIEDAPYSDE